jgi:hypothetical protein
MKIIKSILARLTDTSVTYSLVPLPYEYNGSMCVGYLVYMNYFFLGLSCSKRVAICIDKEEAEKAVQLFQSLSV